MCRKGTVLAEVKHECFNQNMLLNLAWEAQEFSLLYSDISTVTF